MSHFLRMTPPLLRTIKKTLKLHVTLSQDDPPLPEDDENKEERASVCLGCPDSGICFCDTPQVTGAGAAEGEEVL